MVWNCGFFGDFPEGDDFCFTDCPHEKCLQCLRLQGSFQYPLEVWRVAAEIENKRKEREDVLAQAKAFACGHMTKRRKEEP